MKAVGDRHAVSRTAAEAAQDAEMERVIMDDFLADPVATEFAVGANLLAARKMLGAQCVAGAPAEALRDTARLGCELGVTLFARATATEPVTVTINGSQVTLEPTGPTSETAPNEWADAFGFAILANNHEAQKRLARVPTDVLYQSGTDADEALYVRVSASRFLTTGERFAAPEFAEDDSAFVHAVVAPELRALSALLAGDIKSLNRALAVGVAGHREYVAAYELERDPEYWYAHGLSAIAVEAARRGMDPDVQSDYLIVSPFVAAA